jgi:sugar-specific transcriptional regulator TrmB
MDYHHFDLNINKLDNDFLIEMMEIGESIEDSNSPENKIEQETLLNKYKQDFDLEFSEIISEWGQTEISEITPELWTKLILWYQKQRYIERLRKLLNDISEI